MRCLLKETIMTGALQEYLQKQQKSSLSYTAPKRWYVVYGLRYVDMWGSSQEDMLSIIQLEGISKYFEETRPCKVGHFYFKNKKYSTFIFRRIDTIQEKELSNFK